MYVEQDSDDMSLYSSDDEGNNINELVIKACLDDIMCEINTTESTWADIREQYSPKQSAFEPFSFTTSTWATFAKAGITGLDNDLVVDEAYSQSATIAAYGVKLLRVALSGPAANRKQITQVGNMLAALCASLSATRDQHRVTLSKMLTDRADAYRRSQGVNEELESEGVNALEHTTSPSSLKPRWWGRRVNRSVVRELIHPYRYERRHSETSEQQQQQLHSCDTVQEVSSTTSTYLSVQLPSIEEGQEAGESVEDEPVAAVCIMISDSDSTSEESADDTDSSLETDSTVLVSGIIQASMQELPLELSRRGIIRDGLLRQGFSESSITAYFEQFSKSTNRNHEFTWKSWAWWCIAKRMDPRTASDEDLNAYISGNGWTEAGRRQMKDHIKPVWSIVEGHRPPRKNKRVVKPSRN
ncbi:hypothetical protein GGH93_006171 [Coemansia aciculifera]|nr:hypothetical protein GGH93_006171 [Coemansia aciculifera]